MTERFRVFHPNYIVDNSIEEGIKSCLPYMKGTFLDLGCGESPYFELVRNHINRYVGINFFQEEIKDRNPSCAYLVGQGENLPLKDSSVDTVLCTEVLEHVQEPDFLMREIKRILKPQGCLVLTVPQVWYLHHIPYDYRRYTRFGLEYLMNKHQFKCLELKPRGRFWLTIGQMFNCYLDYSFSSPPPKRWTWDYFVYRFFRAVRRYLYAFNYYAGSCLDHWDKTQLDTLGYVVVGQNQKLK